MPPVPKACIIESMWERFYPEEWVRSAYSVDYPALYREGFRGIIYDIDNTLVTHGAPADDRAVALFHRLRELGFKTELLSNNGKERVRPFAEAVGSGYLYKAGKPARKGYREAMERMGTGNANTVFIGDQLFTDVWGAARSGIYTILVRPIHPKEEIQIVLKRKLERVVLAEFVRAREREGRPLARHERKGGEDEDRDRK